MESACALYHFLNASRTVSEAGLDPVGFPQSFRARIGELLFAKDVLLAQANAAKRVLFSSIVRLGVPILFETLTAQTRSLELLAYTSATRVGSKGNHFGATRQ